MHDAERKLKARWRQMKARCENRRRKDFKYYGARGVSMCSEWRNDYGAFRAWFVHNAGRIDITGFDVDRINPDFGYDPDNCRVVSHCENMKSARVGRGSDGRFICLKA